MPPILSVMGKTVQIRIPQELYRHLSIAAAAMDKSVPDYAQEVLRDAVARDFPQTVNIVKDLAEGLKKKPRGKE